MLYLGYESCKADPDVLIKEFNKPDGSAYYGYVLLYVDDALCINHNPTGELMKLDGYFKMKPGSIGDPDTYLGGKLTQVEVQDPDTEEISLAWGLSPTKYVKAAIDNVEEYLAKNFNGRKLPKKCARSPFATNCRPEMDLSAELDDKLCNYY